MAKGNKQIETLHLNRLFNHSHCAAYGVELLELICAIAAAIMHRLIKVQSLALPFKVSEWNY